MQGFAPTYKHVMPGCSQGNTAWVLRDFAAFREVQGRAADAAKLRGYAASIAKDTLDKMYMAKDGKGFFNVVFPSASDPSDLQVMEMRHVVDFFSVTFGYNSDLV